MPCLFISHSSKDDLVAEAIRVHLVERGWSRNDIFVDFDVEGIKAHERWKTSLAEANSGANALLCLASPDWLASEESQVERRVAETLRELDPQRPRAVLVAIWRGLTMAQLRAKGLGEYQIADLSAAGISVLIPASLPGRPGQPGRRDDVKFNRQALEKIERALRLIGVAPESFEWTPRDPARPSPYPGLEAFTENDTGVFFGRESRLAEAIETIDGLRRGGSRLLTIIAASGVGKSSFLRAGLWPRLARQSGVAPLIVLRPGAGIISGREGGLIHGLADWFRRAGHAVAPGDLRACFRDRPAVEGLSAVLTKAAAAAGEDRTLVLGIDQAEEIFDLTDRTTAAEAAEFLGALLTLLATPPGGVDLLAVFAIRADSFDPLAEALKHASDAAEARGTGRPTALDPGTLPLLPLSATAYRDVIRRPAQVALKTDRDIFEPALVEHLISSFTGANALPLLAMTLDQLYAEYGPHQRITRVDYDALYGADAGAEGPVRRALAEAYRMAGAAGTAETLNRLLIPGLATWDPAAGEAGAAKRRIAVRAALLDGDSDLTRLADALASPQVRLLTRGGAEAGPTLEVAHEALLRVHPVKGWIEELSALLKLRDEIEHEATEWRNAEARLAAARAQADGGGDLDALQRDIDAAIAARRGPRLEAALSLIEHPAFARLLRRDGKERAYLDACEAHETEEIDKQRRTIGRAFVKPAMRALEDGVSEHALRLAAAGALLAHDTGFKLVPALWGPAVRAICDGRTRVVLKGHSGGVFVASFRPYGRQIVTVSNDSTVRVWDAVSGTEIAVLNGHASTVRSVSFSQDGRRIVTGSYDNTARVWDPDSKAEIAVLKGHTNWVLSASFSPDGRRIVTASNDSTARVWDPVSGAEIVVLNGHTGWVRSASFSPDGRRIVTASNDGTARIWDAAKGTGIAVLKGDEESVLDASFSPDGCQIVTASSNNTARVYDAVRGTEIALLKGHTSWVLGAWFSPDGRQIVTASSDRTARVWDAESGTMIALLKGHEEPVVSALFSSDGSRIVTASGDNTARLWDAISGEEIALLKGHTGPVSSASFSPDGRRIVTASHDNTARVWDAVSGTSIALLNLHEETAVSVSFSPDGRRMLTESDDGTVWAWDTDSVTKIPVRIVTASDDGTARVWDAESGTKIVSLKGHEDPVVSASLSPDGRRIVTASDDHTARVWDAESGTEIAVLKGHTKGLKSASFSPDGRRIATASADGTARVWDARSGITIAVSKGHLKLVASASFSPDGRRIVTASDDRTARVWDAESGIEIILLEGHMYGVQSASFSPDGCRIVTASFDSTARVWDAEDGTEIVLLKGHTNLVVNASFSPDGRRIVTTSDDCTARVWDAESGTEIALLRGHRAPVHSASFSPDGRWIVTRAYDNTVRVWDVSRTATAVSERTLTLAAALGHGVGWCTDAERTDFLMQYAQHDLYAEALKQLGCKGDDPDLSEVAAALAAPLHPNCYLSPTLFAQKFVG